MKDRLGDLQKANGSSARRQHVKQESVDETDHLLSKEQWDSIEGFLEKADAVRTEISSLEADIKEMVMLHSRILSDPNADASVTQHLNSLTELFNQKAKSARTKLNEMEEIMKKKNVGKSNEVQAAGSRIMRDQVMTISHLLCNAISNFNKEQMDYKEKHLNKIKHHLKIQNVDMTDEAIMDAVENGDISQRLTGIVLAYEERKALYEDVRSRRDELVNVEKSIRGLAEMFHDLHLLVVSQGEILNNIEMNVERSYDYAINAKGNIADARKKQQQARKMKIIMIIVIIILLILFFFLLKTVICFYTPIC